jgi:ABC-2 type transport system ATP-binding protein
MVMSETVFKAVFKAEGIIKRFGRQRALNGLDLEIVPGAVTVLLGRNGAGKSTLFRLALGSLKPEAGKLAVVDCDPVRQPRKLRQQVGFVPDVPDVYEWMSADDLFRFLRPQYPTWDDAEARRLCAFFEIPRDIPFKALSRGQGMKAMLAAALAPRPAFLLLDEPFAGLDPIAREDVLRGVIAELGEQQRTVLCATHDLDIAARIADHIALIHEGVITRHGPIEEILEIPAGEPTAVPRRLHEALVAAGEI